MSDKPKFCVDCKWYDGDRKTVNYCTLYARPVYNVVTGHVVNRPVALCEYERASFFGCGKRARFFQPKEQA